MASCKQLLFLSSYILINPVGLTIAQPNFVYEFCINNGNYISNGIYQRNLNTVLSSFSSNTDKYGFYSSPVGQNPDRVNAIDLRALMDTLRNQAASSSGFRKFAVGNTTGPELQNIFALVQCTPDLSKQECRDCLLGAGGDIRNSSAGKIGGRIFRPSCNLRYKTHSFFNAIPADAPPQTSPPGALPPASPGAPPPPPSPPTPTTGPGSGIMSIVLNRVIGLRNNIDRGVSVLVVSIGTYRESVRTGKYRLVATCVTACVTVINRYVLGLGQYTCDFQSQQYTDLYPSWCPIFLICISRYVAYRPIFRTMIMS
ncbi:hypothetical protein ACSBR1_015150 [Camellia fascicularis]